MKARYINLKQAKYSSNTGDFSKYIFGHTQRSHVVSFEWFIQ